MWNVQKLKFLVSVLEKCRKFLSGCFFKVFFSLFHPGHEVLILLSFFITSFVLTSTNVSRLPPSGKNPTEVKTDLLCNFQKRTLELKEKGHFCFIVERNQFPINDKQLSWTKIIQSSWYSGIQYS